MGTTIAAWKAASAFALVIMAMALVARHDPAMAATLALIAADPWLLATALLMVALAQQA